MWRRVIVGRRLWCEKLNESFNGAKAGYLYRGMRMRSILWLDVVAAMSIATEKRRDCLFRLRRLLSRIINSTYLYVFLFWSTIPLFKFNWPNLSSHSLIHLFFFINIIFFSLYKKLKSNMVYNKYVTKLISN
jgi:hypothetical protein